MAKFIVSVSVYDGGSSSVSSEIVKQNNVNVFTSRKAAVAAIRVDYKQYGDGKLKLDKSVDSKVIGAYLEFAEREQYEEEFIVTYAITELSE